MACSAVLVFSRGSSEDSSDSSAPTSQCRAREVAGEKVVLAAGCTCGDEAVQSSKPPYPSKCSRQAIGGHSICCKGKTFCKCEMARCGTSGGNCMCGSGISLSTDVTSCTATASMCCTQDTGYCYCEDGCNKRFASAVVGTCDVSSAPLRCDTGLQEVESCE